MNSPSNAYVGRFAPSPTGPLHFGSLVAAAASYLDARANGGKWLVRMEDIDARTRPGADSQILSDLEDLGFEWDGPVVYQSSRIDAYRQAFGQLQAAGILYPCCCSRKDTVGRYSGKCSAGLLDEAEARSWRIRVPEPCAISFEDRTFGNQRQDVAATVGDFIVRRADGPFAYQLAVVVDDAHQGVTHIVRGADLLDNTPRQIFLQRLLRLPTAAYAHVPVAVDNGGNKLSKSKGAACLNNGSPGGQLLRALAFLGQDTPAELAEAQCLEILRWAAAAWSLQAVPRTSALLVPSDCGSVF